jgi:hypothetical protein
MNEVEKTLEFGHVSTLSMFPSYDFSADSEWMTVFSTTWLGIGGLKHSVSVDVNVGIVIAQRCLSTL